MECKNGDDSMGDCVASCAADGGVGGWAWKTDVFSTIFIERTHLQ